MGDSLLGGEFWVLEPDFFVGFRDEVSGRDLCIGKQSGEFFQK